ncbi:MAG: RNA-protein complex protein Nop10 [Promethearchaeati archaeon SRVP18_Atabeyarchaeia-1]
MPKLLRKCAQCGRYTLKKDACPYCGGKLTMPYPPKFSPVDKYGEYRRKYKMEEATESSKKEHAESLEQQT